MVSLSNLCTVISFGFLDCLSISLAKSSRKVDKQGSLVVLDSERESQFIIVWKFIKFKEYNKMYGYFYEFQLSC